MDQFLANIIYGINGVIHNYGITMILFTLIIKVLILPLDYKSRKGMRKMTLVQPEVAKLQKKYANDKEKLNQKMSELYRKEGVSPLSGCLPMLVSMVVLYIMWAGMRYVANEQIAKQVLEMIAQNTKDVPTESFLWIKNIWMPDSPFHPILAMQTDLQAIPLNVWTNQIAQVGADKLAVLGQEALSCANLNTVTSSVWAALQNIPGYTDVLNDKSTIWNILTTIQVYGQYNGFFILPVMSAVTQYIMTAMQPQQPTADAQQNSTGKMMKYFFPIFSLWICCNFNAMFALYWVVSNLYAWVQTIILNKIFDSRDKKAAAVKQEEDSLK